MIGQYEAWPTISGNAAAGAGRDVVMFVWHVSLHTATINNVTTPSLSIRLARAVIPRICYRSQTSAVHSQATDGCNGHQPAAHFDSLRCTRCHRFLAEVYTHARSWTFNIRHIQHQHDRPVFHCLLFSFLPLCCCTAHSLLSLLTVTHMYIRTYTHFIICPWLLFRP